MECHFGRTSFSTASYNLLRSGRSLATRTSRRELREVCAMGNITVVFGILLIIVGAVGFALSYQADKPPYTALIPAGFGLVLAILGVLARKDNLRKHVMHLAAMVGLIGA